MSDKKQRKSPEQSATLYKVGTKKTGLDGNKWIIVETQTGTKRWKLFRKIDYKASNSGSEIKKSGSKKSKVGSKRKTKGDSKIIKSMSDKFKKLGKNTKSFIKIDKLGSMNKKYEIHDNGGRPFKVTANKDGIKIYTYATLNENPKYDVLLLTIKKFIGFWPGFDTGIYTTSHGNSILVQETITQYIYIGSVIYKFESPEEILDFVSPIGNSDVPYPVAYSENYVYFMLEGNYVQKTNLVTEAIPANADEIYGEFYGHLKSSKKIVKNNFKKIKILVKKKF